MHDMHLKRDPVFFSEKKHFCRQKLEKLKQQGSVKKEVKEKKDKDSKC